MERNVSLLHFYYYFIGWHIHMPENTEPEEIDGGEAVQPKIGSPYGPSP